MKAAAEDCAREVEMAVSLQRRDTCKIELSNCLSESCSTVHRGAIHPSPGVRI